MWNWYGELQSGSHDAPHGNSSLELEGVFAKLLLVYERKTADSSVTSPTHFAVGVESCPTHPPGLQGLCCAHRQHTD